MQELYAHFQKAEEGIVKTDNLVLNSMNRFYECYLHLLLLLVEIQAEAHTMWDEAHEKHIKKDNDPDLNPKFIHNPVLTQLSSSGYLASKFKKHKISWSQDTDLLRSLALQLRKSAFYAEYLESKDESYDFHKEFVLKVYKQIIKKSEKVAFRLEERFLNWEDDEDLLHGMLVKQLKNLSADLADHQMVFELYNDEEDDLKYIDVLYRKTILNATEFEDIIAKKADNWDKERIALTDLIIMQMALSEMLFCHNIPLKVTINEFIELAKVYSTPKSKQFVNGLLDKISIDLRKENRIQKTGRGLLEG